MPLIKNSSVKFCAERSHLDFIQESFFLNNSPTQLLNFHCQHIESEKLFAKGCECSVNHNRTTQIKEVYDMQNIAT